jgi:ribosome-associated translation inhibitor RaiA
MSPRWRRLPRIRPAGRRVTLPVTRPRRLMGEGSPGSPKHEMQGGAGRAIPRRPSHERQAEPPAAPSGLSGQPTVSVVADPELGERARQAAFALVSRLEQRTPRPLLHARVTLRQLPDPALERPATAKATLDVNGRLVRAHVAAKTMDDALDRLEERLSRNLKDLEEMRRVGRHATGAVEEGEWRHGNLPAVEPEYLARPVEERELRRHKTHELSAVTPEQAVLDMAALDRAFYLFTNVDTGEESVVYRRPNGEIGLLCVHPREAEGAGAPLAPDPSPAPVLGAEAAIARLDASGEPFVFYVDAETKRGNVLYRRFDGHYGLIEPTGDNGGLRS